MRTTTLCVQLYWNSVGDLGKRERTEWRFILGYDAVFCLPTENRTKHQELAVFPVYKHKTNFNTKFKLRYTHAIAIQIIQPPTLQDILSMWIQFNENMINYSLNERSEKV